MITNLRMGLRFKLYLVPPRRHAPLRQLHPAGQADRQQVPGARRGVEALPHPARLTTAQHLEKCAECKLDLFSRQYKLNLFVYHNHMYT